MRSTCTPLAPHAASLSPRVDSPSEKCGTSELPEENARSHCDVRLFTENLRCTNFSTAGPCSASIRGRHTRTAPNLGAAPPSSMPSASAWSSMYGLPTSSRPKWSTICSRLSLMASSSSSLMKVVDMGTAILARFAGGVSDAKSARKFGLCLLGSGAAGKRNYCSALSPWLTPRPWLHA